MAGTPPRRTRAERELPGRAVPFAHTAWPLTSLPACHRRRAETCPALWAARRPASCCADGAAAGAGQADFTSPDRPRWGRPIGERGDSHAGHHGRVHGAALAERPAPSPTASLFICHRDACRADVWPGALVRTPPGPWRAFRSPSGCRAVSPGTEPEHTRMFISSAPTEDPLHWEPRAVRRF